MQEVAALSMGDSALLLLLYIQPFVSPPTPPLIYTETSSSLHNVLWLKLPFFGRLLGSQRYFVLVVIVT